MKPPETTTIERMFAELATRTSPLPSYGAGHTRVWNKMWSMVRPALNLAGLSRLSRFYYRAATQEFVRLFRTRTGPELCAEIRQSLFRWQSPAYGLDPVLLEKIVLACYQCSLSFLRPGPKPQARSCIPKRKKTPLRRTYAQTLRSGLVPRNAEVTIQEQVARYQQAIRENRAISHTVRQVLLDQSVPLREFIYYNAFAYRLLRRARRYSGQTLQTLAQELVDQGEAKGRNRKVLLALTRALTGLPALK